MSSSNELHFTSRELAEAFRRYAQFLAMRVALALEDIQERPEVNLNRLQENKLLRRHVSDLVAINVIADQYNCVIDLPSSITSAKDAKKAGVNLKSADFSQHSTFAQYHAAFNTMAQCNEEDFSRMSHPVKDDVYDSIVPQLNIPRELERQLLDELTAKHKEGRLGDHRPILLEKRNKTPAESGVDIRAFMFLNKAVLARQSQLVRSRIAQLRGINQAYYGLK